MSIRTLQRQVVLIGLLSLLADASITSAGSQPPPSPTGGEHPSGTFTEMSVSEPKRQTMDTETESVTVPASQAKHTLQNLSSKENWPSPVNDR